MTHLPAFIGIGHRTGFQCAHRGEARPHVITFSRVGIGEIDHHTGVGIAEDFSEGYRDKNEFNEWKSKDPVAVQRERILNDGLSVQELESLEQNIDLEIEEAVIAAKEAPEPSNNEILKGVFT